MRRGYVIAWSGWDVTVAAGPGALSITVPVATNPDGSPIVSPSLEEFVVDAAAPTNHLSYPAASTDTSAASLSVRVHATDPPVAIPSTGWEYVDNRTVRLLPAGTAFQQGRLYDLVYPARDPMVAGLAFAATRDFVGVSPSRGGGRLRHAESRRRRPALRLRLRALAAGALPARSRPSRVQRGREREHRLRRAAELPRGAGRWIVQPSLRAAGPDHPPAPRSPVPGDPLPVHLGRARPTR